VVASTVAEVVVAAFMAVLRLAAHATVVGCTAAHAAVRTIIPALPITIPVPHPADPSTQLVAAPAIAIAQAIARA
jgi:hypothetical protein